MSLKRYIIITAAAVAMAASAIGLARGITRDGSAGQTIAREIYSRDGMSHAFSPDEAPPIFDSKTGELWLPLRFTIELAGGGVTWNDEELSTEASLRGTRLNIMEEKRQASLNGETIILSYRPQNIGGSLYVTASVVESIFSINSAWNAEENILTMTAEKEKLPLVNCNILEYDDSDMKYSVVVPVISELNDEKFRTALNAGFLETALEDIKKFALAAKLEQDVNTRFTWKTELEVYDRRENMVSFRIAGKRSEPGKYNLDINNTYNIDLKSQSNIFLEDLFKNKKYKKVIVNNINKQLKADGNGRVLKELEGYRDEFNTDFCISSTGIVIFVKTTEKGGYQEFEIPFKEFKNQFVSKYSYLKKK